jgi:hypothetical protein
MTGIEEGIALAVATAVVGAGTAAEVLAVVLVVAFNAIITIGVSPAGDFAFFDGDDAASVRR